METVPANDLVAFDATIAGLTEVATTFSGSATVQ